MSSDCVAELCNFLGEWSVPPDSEDDSEVVAVDGAAVHAPSDSGSDDEEDDDAEEKADSDDEEASGDEEDAEEEEKPEVKAASGGDGLEGQEEGDIVLECRDCAEKFLFTVGEQAFFEEKGFDGQPARCKIEVAPAKGREQQARSGQQRPGPVDRPRAYG